MRTMSRGPLRRRAFRLGLLSVTAVFISACSSDSDRLSFFGVDQAQPTTVAASQPGFQATYAQPQVTYQQPTYQAAPQVTASGAQPLTQPAPYTAPTFTAPGYPQTTASISRPTVQTQQTYQALPQPVVQQPTYTAVQRSPVSAPTAHLAQTPGGMVGAQVPRTTQVASVQAPRVVYQQPQVTYQQPQVTYQQPTFQTAPQTQPITTASIGAPQVIMPQRVSPDPITTASIPPVQSVPASLPTPQMMPAQLPSQSSREAGWSAVGGTRVQVQQGETLFSMSRRYGIPVDVLQRVNNISDPSSVRVGQQIIIPVYSTTSAGMSVASAGVDTTFTGSTPTTSATRRVPSPTPRPASLRSVATAQPSFPTSPQTTTQTAQVMPTAGTHVVAAGETLYSVARRYNMSAQQLIAANSISDPNAIRVGQRLVVSSSGQALPPVAQLPAPTQTPAQVVASRSYTPPRPAETQAAVQQTAAIQQVAARNDDIAEQTPLQFRWPIRGRVLAGFGVQENGVRNDGVNIAVPEGASIRAAEEGEVVYAGNELRGFGNLVLVQHRGGYVTAYAHNSRLDVQRGDRVSRGDVIARAGSTGDVDTPQLHFEIRRGTTPVDPGPYLPSS
ncbi:MAG: peptidoglycan DD-metalloendopeptidase family protein [Hyphomicrobiales bacterium]|jgi:murein DD-endopeptidase MepM/ murein hydrolase activator NlpD